MNTQFIILGAGSIGLLFASHIARRNIKVHAVISKRLFELEKEMALQIQDYQGNSIKVEKNIIFYTDLKRLERNINNTRPNEIYLIISSKTYSLKNICEQYKRIIERTNSIILLQNGLDNETLVKRYFPHHTIYRLITSNGAYINADLKLIYAGRGPTYLCLIERGDLLNNEQRTEFEQNLLKILNDSGIETRLSPNPVGTVWEKALINIGINAFGALTSLRNGDLIKIEELKRAIEETVKEAWNTAIKMDINLKNVEYYIEIVFKVIKATAANKNSMLQDIIKKRPTEIDYINGAIVNFGKKLGYPTPYNLLLTALIKGKEYSYSN